MFLYVLFDGGETDGFRSESGKQESSFGIVIWLRVCKVRNEVQGWSFVNVKALACVLTPAEDGQSFCEIDRFRASCGQAFGVSNEEF